MNQARTTATSTSGTSDRLKKKSRVMAVADQRTSSIIISAASEMMPQIEMMVHDLDASPARKQKVFVYNLENAEVQEVVQVLQDMFQRNTSSMNRNSSSQQNSPLTTRQNNGNTSSSGSSSFGGSSFGASSLGSSRGGGLP